MNKATMKWVSHILERSNGFLVRNSGACGLNKNTCALQGVPSQARITRDCVTSEVS